MTHAEIRAAIASSYCEGLRYWQDGRTHYVPFRAIAALLSDRDRLAAEVERLKDDDLERLR